MKILLTIATALLFNLKCLGQKTISVKNLNSGIRCLVAHYDEDMNVFTCNYNGTYYPSYIKDTTIKKWLVKSPNGKDSSWYYRTIIDEVYIWDKQKPKDKTYGYVMQLGSGGSMTIYDKYNGKDTLIFKRQAWRPK